MISPNGPDGRGTNDPLEDLNRKIARATEAYNQCPDPEMGYDAVVRFGI